MDAPIKAYIFLYLMEFMIILGMANVNSQMQISQAQNYVEDAVREIENSGYNPNVVNKVISQAQTAGRTISITVYFKDRTSATYSSPTAAYDSMKDAVMARVDMNYPNTNVFLGYSDNKSVRRFSQ